MVIYPCTLKDLGEDRDGVPQSYHCDFGEVRVAAPCLGTGVMSYWSTVGGAGEGGGREHAQNKCLDLLKEMSG